MFYLGGMTLGYFTPPTPKPRAGKDMPEAPPTDREAVEDCQPECEEPSVRAFVAPRHLFY
ncbi:hypothetical protein [Ensifer sp. BR816]|uniref:hypothetical protein n=1 Tax=Rhizobium sp. (strain BR816) TaxID=1057002 RepID=UPI00037CA1C4|nr:hypothetical protein [Ensifer sp. BR816]